MIVMSEESDWKPYPLGLVLKSSLFVALTVRFPVSLIVLDIAARLTPLRSASFMILLLAALCTVIIGDVIETLIDRRFVVRQHRDGPRIPIVMVIVEILLFAVVAAVVSVIVLDDVSLAVWCASFLWLVRLIFVFAVDTPWHEGISRDDPRWDEFRAITRQTAQEIREERQRQFAEMNKRRMKRR